MKKLSPHDLRHVPGGTSSERAYLPIGWVPRDQPIITPPKPVM